MCHCSSCQSKHKIQLEVFIEHIPHGTSTGYSAATIDVTSLPMRIKHIQGVGVIASFPGPHVFRVWAWERGYGSDLLPYIQQREAEEVGPNVTNNRK